ncbi:ArsR family transcriptional regulator [Microbacteriaceae bacterium SG_E_30_P1]|uniref:ArsR family transcriptional regulator n=1 Tax=Antiquaquibacter oligotrophicus TaxID=2880260 RepID=A0ABT6KQK4_9MICO|nr:metalloregulator ArsR/SmtB family transcription factor [Antiquaquibacter oligotrophicus]MDH6182050.1 ArsR family transcriptional regulator [Antiquaquibacter oligotrophicus]UDF12282.1 metalloregulator ArsR/SmtB family transcription factor [Antiquaquibacter oligotrophicus]
MADIFDVISDATRRDILGALLARYVSSDSETGEISVGDLVEVLGLSQPTVSKHLKVLRDHGLVSVREEGQHRYYRLDSTPLEIVEDWLIPYLSADFDDEIDAEELGAATAYTAWAGSEVGSTLGRRAAEGAHRARQVVDQVGKRLPAPPWRGRDRA